MKAKTYLNGLRAYVAFVVIIFFSIFLSCNEDPLVEPEAPPIVKPTIITNEISAISSVSPVTVEVSAFIKNNGGAPLEEAGICWSVSSSPNMGGEKVVFDITKNELGAFSAQFSDLKEGVVYRFKAYAVNKIGVAYGEEKIFYLSPRIYKHAEAWPGEVENITLTSATLVAFVIPKEDETELIFEFAPAKNSVVFSQIPVTGKFSGYDTIRVSVEVNKLNPAEQYYFRLKAVNPRRETVSVQRSFETYAVADYDGNLYKQVKIGNQIWLTSNLKTTSYANGDPIPNVKDKKTWSETKEGAYVWYDNDESYGEDYGALYNFYVGVDKRELIPGWHVPTFEEWGELYDMYSGYYMPALIEKSFWTWQPELWENVPPHPESLFNSSGFSARAAGLFSMSNDDDDANNYDGYKFEGLGGYSFFWTNSEFGPGANFERLSNRFLDHGPITRMNQGLSLRLMKNEE
jgi:uncharacterized protein (TIGR02145 family)